MLGVTGGIASGKTTVANMLQELGTPIVDLDLIARQVVEAGKPAWKDIIGYFGDEVIRKDGAIDRKRLSGIVFRDPAKRKKLESFTHTAIFEEYLTQVNAIAAGKPGCLTGIKVQQMHAGIRDADIIFNQHLAAACRKLGRAPPAAVR